MQCYLISCYFFSLVKAIKKKDKNLVGTIAFKSEKKSNNYRDNFKKGNQEERHRSKGD